MLHELCIAIQINDKNKIARKNNKIYEKANKEYKVYLAEINDFLSEVNPDNSNYKEMDSEEEDRIHNHEDIKVLCDVVYYMDEGKIIKVENLDEKM